jgi:hypothetical protein
LILLESAAEFLTPLAGSAIGAAAAVIVVQRLKSLGYLR